MSHRVGSLLQDRLTAIDRNISAGSTLHHNVRQPHVTSRRRDARLLFRFGNRNEGAESLLALSAIAYARTRNASPTPSSAESPSNTTTPGKAGERGHYTSAGDADRSRKLHDDVCGYHLDVKKAPESLAQAIAIEVCDVAKLESKGEQIPILAGLHSMPARPN
jgi:hypothetical protein